MLTVLVLAACARASGEVVGGSGTFDTAPPPFGNECTDEAELKRGSKWSELYADYFAREGEAACSRNECHGTKEGRGSAGSGFECFDQKACREGLLRSNLVRIPDDVTRPEGSFLYDVLRRRDPATGELRGFMPDRPGCFVFSQASLDRIAAWIRSGAPDD